MSGTAIVVGAGVLGVCVADRLAGDGWAVTLVEQVVPGHVRATSGGDTRVLRSLHADPTGWYAASARRARERWLALGAEVGEPLFEQTGVAWLAQRDGGAEAVGEAALLAAGIPCERVDPGVAAQDLGLPGLDPSELAFVLWEPEAGFVRARRSVQVLAARAVRERGVVARYGEQVVPDARGECLGGADLVVWACGPWLARLFGELVDMAVVRRDYVYLAPPGPGYEAPPFPPWIDYDEAIYGLGDLDGLGVKVAVDAGKELYDPQTARRELHVPTEERARAYLARRFPALADQPLVGARTCQYELTPDTEFVIARHPANRRVWLLGGGSGHAFKHGPALADHLVELVGADAEPDPRFGLGPRAGGGPNLVTSGR